MPYLRRAPFILPVMLTVAVLAALQSCTTPTITTNPILTRLKNRGPVAVSSDNPYVASNMMLDKVKQESEEVRGFLEKRGAPSVIEVEQGLFSEPSMFFYYAEHGEYYRLERDDEFWLIEGPFGMEEAKLAKLRPLTQVQRATQERLMTPPVAPVKSPAPRPEAKQPVGEEKKMLPLHPEAKEMPLPGAALAAASEAPGNAPAVAPVRPAAAAKPVEEKANVDQSLIQQIIARGDKATGELTPKGDLVHYVTYPDEDLSIIARWYTYEAWNAGKIARVSGIAANKPLSPGDTLVIPAYLLKNKVRLTREGLDALKK